MQALIDDEDDDVDAKRIEILTRIKKAEELDGDFAVSSALQRNVVLVGRTRTGKSTIKTMLVDAMVIAGEQQLLSQTKDPVFETLHITRKKTSRTREASSDEEFRGLTVPKEKVCATESCEDLVINIIDTPGLFERGTNEMDTRDNEIIMKSIDTCINAEITKFHVICFCVALTSGINQEDIQALKLLLETIGDQIAPNACLVITHSESKTKQQRKAFRAQLRADKDFKQLIPYFKKGIFFSGVLKREDYDMASKTLLRQYVAVTDYRVKLINMFSESVKPFPLVDTLISESKRAHKTGQTLDAELKHAIEEFTVVKNGLDSKMKEMSTKLAVIESELFQKENELGQRLIDLEDRNTEIIQMKATEASLRKMIKELEDKSTLNETQRKQLQENLGLEEQQRQRVEAERQQEMEARREAEKQRVIELERRRSEQAEAQAKYYKQVEAQQEEIQRREQAERARLLAEQQLQQEKNKSCTVS